MAHIGKIGPVVFRRDLNLNISNNTSGWYNRTLVQFFNLPPGSANTVNGKVFDCGPATNPTINAIDWESGFLPLPIFQFKCHLIVQINDGLKYFKGVELIQKGAGTILVLHYPNFSELRFPHWDSGIPLTLDFYDTGWFDEPPDAVQLLARGKRWDDGPPH